MHNRVKRPASKPPRPKAVSDPFFSSSSEKDSEAPAFFSPATAPPALAARAELRVGAPGDPFEQEANLVADQVVQRLESSQSQGSTGRVPSDDLRQEMEEALGADLSGVRLHTDEAAQRASAQLHARAFTRGKDIYFGPGEYRPDSREGQHLLAHELTHVVQQTSGGASDGIQRRSRDPTPGRSRESSGDRSLVVASDPAEIQERLLIGELATNHTIDGWVEKYIISATSRLELAARFFTGWYQGRPSFDPSTPILGFVADVATAALSVLSVLYPQVALPIAYVGGVLTLSKSGVNIVSNDQAKAERKQRNDVALDLRETLDQIVHELYQVPKGFGERLRQDDKKKELWNNIHLALSTNDRDLEAIAEDELHRRVPLPTFEQVTDRALTEMIYAYENWERKQGLKRLFPNVQDYAWAINKDHFRRQWASRQARKQLGEKKPPTSSQP